MANCKYRQRFPGGKWRSYDSPDGFNRTAELYTDIIKNYDEHPAFAVYHIGFCRNSADDRYFNHVTKRYKLVYVLEGSGWFNGLPVKSGQGFLMWQNRVNSMSADMRSPWKFIYISFSGSLAEQIIMRAGFTPEEREKMTLLLGSGFVDTFRLLHPDETDRYSWWSYMMKSRERNIGWRIDYFLVSERIAGNVKVADIDDQILGSDHCPVILELEGLEA